MSELVQSFVQRISDSWRESVEKIIQTSHILVESEEQLSDVEFLDMVNQLPISQSTISKLLMIGKNSYLPNKVEYLPPHWTTIYEISQLDEQQIDKGIVDQRKKTLIDFIMLLIRRRTFDRTSSNRR